MLVLTVVFNKVARLSAPGGVPYSLLVFAAMLPWQFFSTALSESSTSLIGNANLVSKVYFPRLIVPGGAVVTSFVDFAITLGLMAAMMLWYGYLPDWRLLALPAFVVMAFAAAFGGGLWLSALTVKYRDFRYIVPFILQFGVYISPVGFSSDQIPASWRLLYAANPLVGIIDGFRWSLLRGASPLWTPGLLMSLGGTLFLCLAGLRYFRRVERGFADVI
jgi:lipopolysaccharide transport system permease protein